MSEFDPNREQYLAVVSEWSGLGKNSASRVGNAYPIYSLTTNRVVDRPLEEFPNPGYVFLVNRGDLRGGDFIRVTPSENNQKPYKETDCAFVIKGNIAPIEPWAARAAVVLDVPGFEPDAPETIIRKPEQPVTPIFYVRNGTKIYGPLFRERLDIASYEGVFESLHWSAAGHENVFYEFMPNMLKAQGLTEVVYEPIEPIRNEIIRRPFRLLIGSVDKASSSHPHDRMPESKLAEWYLKSNKLGEVPSDLLHTLRAAADAVPEGADEVIRQRCRRVARLFTSMTAFQSERAAVAGRYLKTEEGKKTLEEAIHREIDRRAGEIEGQVKLQKAEVVAERQRLAAELEKARKDHAASLEQLQSETRQAEAKRDALSNEQAALTQRIRGGISDLIQQIREQVPLVAALAQGAATVVHSTKSSSAQRVEAAPPGWDTVGPLAATKPLAAVTDESGLVDKLTAEFAGQGIGFARDFVANLYVCLKSQGLNLIMGPPGHGKSSAVTWLARALGHGNALLEIPVRRTWSDDRYLLGFFDSFHGRYDPGPIGLATRLVQAMRDWENGRQGLYVILLDEFNLAAPEYYFSQLLQLVTKPFDQSRVLRLFDPAMLPADSSGILDHVRLPACASFWGTINYDETTERLSPRLLDRTGMIVLGPTDVVPIAEPAPGLTKGVPASQLVGEFVRQPDQCPEDSWDLVRPLFDHLNDPREAWGAPLHLSPRVVEGVRRYLANADGVMAPRTAADFAFQQRVLPVVRGRGGPFATRIRALAELLSTAGLERSLRHVREALTLADAHYGDIDFLAYV